MIEREREVGKQIVACFQLAFAIPSVYRSQVYGVAFTRGSAMIRKSTIYSVNLPGRIAVARDTKPVYRARIVYNILPDLKSWLSRIYCHFSTAAFLDVVLFVREELSNINYARREREKAPGAGIRGLPIGH